MPELLVAADDRSGALEVAGACASRGSGVTVVTSHAAAAAARGVVVLDLASRHLSPAEASARARSAHSVPAGRVGHKIDSTLRGNWAAELVARHRAGADRVLLVPALPALGRQCVGGVVLEGDRPVSLGGAGADPFEPVRSSRPAEHLVAAGAPDVAELASPSGIPAWLAGGCRFAVCDSRTDRDLERVTAEIAGRRGLLVAGTSAALGAVALGGCQAARTPRASGPVLVVCGSLHARARAQVGVLVERGAARIAHEPATAVEALCRGQTVVMLPLPPDGELTTAGASRVAAALGVAARSVLATAPVGTLVVVGGDTVAEVIGDEPVIVGGLAAPGTAWCAGPLAPLVLTRAGGFGGPNALIELVEGVRG